MGGYWNFEELCIKDGHCAGQVVFYWSIEIALTNQCSLFSRMTKITVFLPLPYITQCANVNITVMTRSKVPDDRAHSAAFSTRARGPPTTCFCPHVSTCAGSHNAAISPSKIWNYTIKWLKTEKYIPREEKILICYNCFRFCHTSHSCTKPNFYPFVRDC